MLEHVLIKAYMHKLWAISTATCQRHQYTGFSCRKSCAEEEGWVVCHLVLVWSDW